MRQPKEKRRGGARDESEIHIGYNRRELAAMLDRIRVRCEVFIRLYEEEERKNSLRAACTGKIEKKCNKILHIVPNRSTFVVSRNHPGITQPNHSSF